MKNIVCCCLMYEKKSTVINSMEKYAKKLKNKLYFLEYLLLNKYICQLNYHLHLSNKYK